MSALSVAVWTVVIIALSAFFVAVEFALMAAKRHRLEAAAATSVAARAALRNASELSLLLAGSQLGITVCTLALGAITKPAVHHAITPALAATGLPETVADVVAFILALLVVTFLHLVVGEMAPKSWAIAHPERSAILLSLPMRGFMAATRPVLRSLNSAANWLVRRVGGEPVDELATGQDPESLRHLVEHSANVGALDAAYQSPITGALDLRHLRVADVLTSPDVTAVPAAATIGQVQATAQHSGHRRVLLRDHERTIGVVHVRDTLPETDLDRPAAPLARPHLELAAELPLHKAIRSMRDTSTHLAVVIDGGREVGVVTLTDILPRLLPQGRFPG